MDRRVVLLHGVGLDHTMWDPVVALLAGDADVVTPDLPGHGARPPAPAGVTLAELADGRRRRHPARLASGRFLARRPGGPAPGPAPARTGGDAHLGQLGMPAHRRGARGRPGPSAHRRARLRRERRGVAAPLVRRHRRRPGTGAPHGSHAAGQRPATASCIATASSPPRTPRSDPSWIAITVPALAVTGELDPGSTPEMTRRLAEAMPGLPSGHRAGRTPHAPRRNGRGSSPTA